MTDLTRPQAVACALAVVTGLLVAGCSQDDGTDTGADGRLGPISQRVADLEDRLDTDVMAAQTNALENKVADCMKEQGFDYTPMRQDAADLAATLELPDASTPEFAQQYGYGITTWDDLAEAAGLPEQEPTEEMLSDEYNEALMGQEYLDDPAAAQMPGGCYGQAYSEVFGEDSVAMDTTVARDIAQLTVEADHDDRVTAAMDEWETCMADEGYDYATPDDAAQSIISRAFDPTTQELVTGQALSTLRTEEIDTAVDDIACRDSSGLTQARAQALADLETEYYNAHKGAVDAYLTQLEEFIGKQ